MFSLLCSAGRWFVRSYPSVAGPCCEATEAKRICSKNLFLLVLSEVYIFKQVSKINSLLCLCVFSLKIHPVPGDLFTLTESLS